ncbi:hypothetical protein H0W32_02785 [Patescibacteria group bacterium]|nr:hypothetical protein [Patescibacteria group bacterium]
MSPAQIATLREPILAQLEQRRQCTDKLNDQIHQLQKQAENDSNEKKQLQSCILTKDGEIASLKATEVLMQERMEKLVKEYITSPPTALTTPTPTAEATTTGAAAPATGAAAPATGAAAPATVAPATAGAAPAATVAAAITSTSDVLPP